MLRAILGLAALAVGAGVVLAQNLDAIKQRREAMSTIATASIGNYNMMKGETPFDLAKLQSALKTMQDQAAKFKGLFPADSKTGGDTDASPKIWQAKAEFEAAADGLVAAIKAAAGSIKDEATLKAEYPKVANSCGGCHKQQGDGFAPRLGDSFKRLKK
jgi:cytochrome c556